jgi:hypothetical protein
MCLIGLPAPELKENFRLHQVGRRFCRKAP